MIEGIVLNEVRNSERERMRTSQAPLLPKL